MERSAAAVLDVVEASAAALVDPQDAGRWWRVPESELLGLLQRVQTVTNQLAVVCADLVGEAQGRGVPGAAGARSTAGWLSQSLPVTPAEASALADLAAVSSTPELAPLDDVRRAGLVSPDRALVVARAVTALPAAVDPDTRRDAAELLADQAVHLDRTRLRRLADHLRHRLDPEAGERVAADEDTDRFHRSLALHEDARGTWWLRGRLPQAAGQALAAALEPLAAPRPADDGTPDDRTAAQRQADALEQLAHRVLAIEPGEPGALPSRGGLRPRVVVHVDLDTALATLGTPGVAGAESPSGCVVSAEQLSLMLCDAEVSPVLRSWLGEPLDVGDSVYAFPTRIRRAIVGRDRHCTFGRCTAPAQWCHVHHLVPFSQGGPTAERNGALLCGRHHRHVHRAGLVGRLTGDRVLWESPPDAGPRRHDRVAAPPSRAVLAEAVRDLALRWVERNPHLRPVPDGRDPGTG